MGNHIPTVEYTLVKGVPTKRFGVTQPHRNQQGTFLLPSKGLKGKASISPDAFAARIKEHPSMALLSLIEVAQKEAPPRTRKFIHGSCFRIANSLGVQPEM